MWQGYVPNKKHIATVASTDLNMRQYCADLRVAFRYCWSADANAL